MKKIYQHIIIGVNQAGRRIIRESSRAFLYHGFEIPDNLSIKVLARAGKDKSLTFSSCGAPMGGDEQAQPAYDGESLSIEETEKKVENRREWVQRLCESYVDLENVIKTEWERTSAPELQREVALN